MNRKIKCLFLIGFLILAVIIISGCVEEGTAAPTLTPTSSSKPAPIPSSTSIPSPTLKPSPEPTTTKIPPAARILVTPSTAKIGESITFSGAASSDSDGNITSYLWSFGDGHTASGEKVTYIYSDRSGSQNVRLKVTDNDSLSDITEVWVKILIGFIKIETTASTWRNGEQPYDIYGAIKQKLEKVGFEVVPPESKTYEAVLFIDYAEKKGAQFTVGYGTTILCTLRFCNKAEHLLLLREVSASTPSPAYSLYGDALDAFQSQVYIKYIGEICATVFSIGDEVLVLTRALREDSDYRTRKSAASALKNLGGIGAVDALTQALIEDSKDEVRAHVAWLLGEIGDARAVEPLTQALNDKESLVRKAAEEALKKIRK